MPFNQNCAVPAKTHNHDSVYDSILEKPKAAPPLQAYHVNTLRLDVQDFSRLSSASEGGSLLSYSKNYKPPSVLHKLNKTCPVQNSSNSRNLKERLITNDRRIADRTLTPCQNRVYSNNQDKQSILNKELRELTTTSSSKKTTASSNSSGKNNNDSSLQNKNLLKKVTDEKSTNYSLQDNFTRDGLTVDIQNNSNNVMNLNSISSLDISSSAEQNFKGSYLNSERNAYQNTSDELPPQTKNDEKYEHDFKIVENNVCDSSENHPKIECSCHSIAFEDFVEENNPGAKSVHCVKDRNLDTCVDSKSDSDIREYLKKQDERLSIIQSQISSLLMQKETSTHAAEKTVTTVTAAKNCSDETQLSKYKEVEFNEINQTLIIKYLEQKDQIHDLQDQVALLNKKIKDLESALIEKNMNNSTPEQVVNLSNCSVHDNSGTEAKLIQLAENCNIDEKEIKNQEGTPAKKTSTSTMTSLIFDGCDKVLFQKIEKTVITDFSNHQKNVSVLSGQSSLGKKSLSTNNQVEEIRKNESSKTASSKRSKNTIPQSADLKKHKRKTHNARLDVLSQKKRGDKKHSSQDNHFNQNVDIKSSTSDHLRTKERKNTSPKFDSDRENKAVNKLPNENNLAIYKTIERNMGCLILESDDQNEVEYSFQNINPFPSKKNVHTQNYFTKPKRKYRSQRSSHRRSPSTSSSSEPSPCRNTHCKTCCASPQGEFSDSSNVGSDSDHFGQRDVHYASSIISNYAMAPSKLTFNTKKYLENYGLVGRKYFSPQDDSEKLSSKKLHNHKSRRKLR